MQDNDRWIFFFWGGGGGGRGEGKYYFGQTAKKDRESFSRENDKMKLVMFVRWVDLMKMAFFAKPDQTPH